MKLKYYFFDQLNQYDEFVAEWYKVFIATFFMKCRNRSACDAPI